MLGITLLAIGRTGDPEDVMTVDAIVYSREDIALYDDIEAATDTGHDLGARERSHGRKTADGRRRLRHPPARDRGRRERRRPKTEEYAEHTFTLLTTADLTRGEATFEEEIETVPVGIFIGLDWVASMSPGSDEPVDRVWRAVATATNACLSAVPTSPPPGSWT
jgi:magnesium transporter